MTDVVNNFSFMVLCCSLGAGRLYSQPNHINDITASNAYYGIVEHPVGDKTLQSIYTHAPVQKKRGISHLYSFILGGVTSLGVSFAISNYLWPQKNPISRNNEMDLHVEVLKKRKQNQFARNFNEREAFQQSIDAHNRNVLKQRDKMYVAYESLLLSQQEFSQVLSNQPKGLSGAFGTMWGDQTFAKNLGYRSSNLTTGITRYSDAVNAYVESANAYISYLENIQGSKNQILQLE